MTSTAAFIIIAFAGGSVMMGMAWGMFRSLPSLSFDSPEAESGSSLVLTGALMSLANPYWIIWWATIGLGYVLSSRELGFAGVGAFFIGHILADLVWYTFVSVGIHKGRKILPIKVYRGIISVCALFLTAYATYLFVNGIRTILA